MTNIYRKPEPIYQDVWDWDIISLYGFVKILHKRHGCMWPEFCEPCYCHEKPRLSSPIIDKNGRELNENHYGLPFTREAEYLLDSKEGSLIPCLSGKLYRLIGPRVPDPNHVQGSIWTIYSLPDLPGPKPSWLSRITRMISRG